MRSSKLLLTVFFVSSAPLPRYGQSLTAARVIKP